MAQEEIKLCQDPSIDLRTAPIGFQCKTSKNITFERVEREGFGEAWKDLNTNFIWSEKIGEFKNTGDVQDETIIHSDATAACEDIEASLPRKEQFKTSKKNGFQEVLPNMENDTYWSSTIYAGNIHDAWLLFLSIGLSYFDTESRERPLSVRCIYEEKK